MKKKVLIIEDDPKNMVLERDLLLVAGYEVFCADNAAGGIAAARAEKPDVILMDLRLPDMRGTQAARLIRQDGELGRIPVVFVTASVMSKEVLEMKEIANCGYISKPIAVGTFAATIDGYIK